MAWPSTGSYTAWSHCFKVTSVATKIDAALDWYGLNLALMPANFWSNVKSDGSDLRFVEDDIETAIPHKLCYINTSNSTGYVFLHLTHGASAASVDIDSYVFVGNAGASSTSTDDVFPANLQGLWALQEEPTSANAVIDWTGNGHNSTSIAGSMTSGDLIAAGPHSGLKCLDFDSNDRVVLPSTLFDACETAGAFTFFCWAKPEDEDTDIGLFASEINQFQLLHKNSGAINTLLRNSTNSGEFIADSGLWQDWVLDEWALIHVVWDGSTLKAYHNGVERASVAATSVRSTTANFSLGRGYSLFWRGKIGVTGMYSAALSADQVATQHKNDTDSGFWSISEHTGSVANVEMDVAATPPEALDVDATVSFVDLIPVSVIVPFVESTVAATLAFMALISMTVSATPVDTPSVAAQATMFYSTGEIALSGSQGSPVITTSGTGIEWVAVAPWRQTQFVLTTGSSTKFLEVKNPAPTFPPGAELIGIRVEVSRGTTGDDEFIQDSSVRLMVGGVAVGDNKAYSSSWFDTSGEYGGVFDKWNIPDIDVDDVTGSDFGIQIKATKSGISGEDGKAEISAIRFEFYYTIGQVVAVTRKFLPFYN